MKASIPLPGLVVYSLFFNCFTPCLNQGNYYNGAGAYPPVYPSPTGPNSNGPYGGGNNPNIPYHHLYLANRGTYTGGGSRDFRTAKFHGRCCRCGPAPAGCDCHRCTDEDIDASQENSAAGKPPLNIVPPPEWSQQPQTNYQSPSNFFGGLKNFLNCGVLGCAGSNSAPNNNNGGSSGLFSGITGLFGGSSGSNNYGNNGGAVPSNFLNCGLFGCRNNGGGGGGIFSGVTSLFS